MCHRRELMPPDSVKYGYFAHKSPLLRFPVWGSMFPYRVYKTRLERTQIVLDIFRGYLFAGEDFLTYFCSTGKSSRLLKV